MERLRSVRLRNCTLESCDPARPRPVFESRWFRAMRMVGSHRKSSAKERATRPLMQAYPLPERRKHERNIVYPAPIARPASPEAARNRQSAESHH